MVSVFPKYLLLPPQITCIIPAIPCPEEGRIMIVVKRGVGCGGRGSVATRLCAWTSDAGAYGEVVWS